MKYKDAFAGCHPIVNFVFFAIVLLSSMIITHPLFLGISLICAFCYCVYLRGLGGLKFTAKYMLPLAILTMIFNPAFTHEGVTMLFRLPSGNPLTLESTLFGFGMAAMMIAVILWFACYTEVMTSDKFVYLFGRIAPAFSLVLSMALRFVPKFVAQIQVVSDAQKSIGRSTEEGGLIKRLRNGITVFSIMVTWSLENAIETADSMKGRGYGLPGRTAFTIYRFDERDRNLLIWIIFAGIFVTSGAIAGGTFWRYYPSVKGAEINLMTVMLAIGHLLLCLTPLILDIYTDYRWKLAEGGYDHACQQRNT